jgi:D-tyrosyl-tRNA(Tyr) deacylase
MRALLQRVSSARVLVADEERGAIGPGLAVLLGVGKEDLRATAEKLADKTAGLRIFSEAGKFSRSLVDCGRAVLVVSQFTLYANTARGRRPGFDEAAEPKLARELYECYVARLVSLGLEVATGEFGAAMSLELVNEGPVTIMLEQ